MLSITDRKKRPFPSSACSSDMTASPSLAAEPPVKGIVSGAGKLTGTPPHAGPRHGRCPSESSPVRWIDRRWFSNPCSGINPEALIKFPFASRIQR